MNEAFPIFDPFGFIEDLTGGAFFDPVAKAIRSPARETTPSGPPPDLMPEEMKINRYIDLLTQAYRVAPCKGCQSLVESAITGAEVYREMQKTGKTADEVKGDETFMQVVRDNVQTMLKGVS